MKDNKPTDKQRVEFAKQLEYMYEISQPGWGKIILFAFVKGVATGLGALIGGTIVVALLVWILSLLGHVPLLDHVIESARQSIEQGS